MTNRVEFLVYYLKLQILGACKCIFTLRRNQVRADIIGIKAQFILFDIFHDIYVNELFDFAVIYAQDNSKIPEFIAGSVECMAFVNSRHFRAYHDGIRPAVALSKD